MSSRNRRYSKIVAFTLVSGVIISFVYFVVNPPAEKSTVSTPPPTTDHRPPPRIGRTSVSPTSPTPSTTTSEGSNKQSTVTRSDLLLILDASGSMKKTFGSQSRMKAAKKAVQEIVAKLHSDREFGLTVYGNGSASCSSLETLIDLGSNNRSDVVTQLSKVRADGDTPIAASIQEVAKTIKNRKQETTIVLISDGEETCKGDPCQVVRQLKSEGYKFTFHGIGVDTNLQADEQLSCLAREGGGTYLKADPRNPEAIAVELERVAIGGQFRIKKPNDPQIDGWKIVPRESDLQEPVLLVRKQSDSQLWGTYPLDRGVYDVYIFIKGKKVSVWVGELEIKNNSITDFDTKK